MTYYDDHPTLAVEAEIIHAINRGGVALVHAEEMELWEIAAALGLHRIETYEERDTREIVETKREEWEETVDTRAAKLAGYSERRRQRALDRKQARAAK